MGDWSYEEKGPRRVRVQPDVGKAAIRASEHVARKQKNDSGRATYSYTSPEQMNVTQDSLLFLRVHSDPCEVSSIDDISASVFPSLNGLCVSDREDQFGVYGAANVERKVEMDPNRDLPIGVRHSGQIVLNAGRRPIHVDNIVVALWPPYRSSGGRTYPIVYPRDRPNVFLPELAPYNYFSASDAFQEVRDKFWEIVSETNGSKMNGPGSLGELLEGSQRASGINVGQIKTAIASGEMEQVIQRVSFFPYKVDGTDEVCPIRKFVALQLALLGVPGIQPGDYEMHSSLTRDRHEAAMQGLFLAPNNDSPFPQGWDGGNKDRALNADRAITLISQYQAEQSNLFVQRKVGRAISGAPPSQPFIVLLGK